MNIENWIQYLQTVVLQSHPDPVVVLVVVISSLKKIITSEENVKLIKKNIAKSLIAMIPFCFMFIHFFELLIQLNFSVEKTDHLIT